MLISLESSTRATSRVGMLNDLGRLHWRSIAPVHDHLAGRDGGTSTPSPEVLRLPAPLRKAEGELRRRIIVPDVVGRIACAGDGRGLGRQPQVREDALHG